MKLSTMRRAAAILLILILAVFALFSSLQISARLSQQVKDAGPEGVTLWMERMQRVERDLPTQGSIGYLSERDFSGLNFEPIDQDEEFAMTQYALAPRILVEGSGLEYVVVNLPYLPVADVDRLMAGKNLRRTMEYGNGLYLGRKVSQ